MTKNASLLTDIILTHHSSIKDFCKAAGIEEEILNAMLSQDIGNAPAADLFAVCRALNVDAEQLVQGRFRYCTYEQRQQAWEDYRQKNNSSTTK